MSVGRNDACPCGSGKKYKKCCLLNTLMPSALDADFAVKMRMTEGKLLHQMNDPAIDFYGKQGLGCGVEEFFTWQDLDLSEKDKNFALYEGFLPWFLFNWAPDPSEPGMKKFKPIPFARHYLNQNHLTLSPFEKEFIEANLLINFSLYQVKSIELGLSMTLFDLLRGITVTVVENKATHYVNIGSVLMTRVVTLHGASICIGTYPVMLPPRARIFAEELLDDYNASEYFSREDLFEYDIEIRELFIDLIIQSLHTSPVQVLRNTDNEKLILTELHFDLKTTVQEAFDALCHLAILQTRKGLLNEAAHNAEGELIEFNLRWCEESAIKKKHTLDNVVMGDIEVSEGRLVVKVNSNERAQKIKRIIKQCLGKKAAYRTAHQERVEEHFSKQGNSPKQQEKAADINQLPEVQAFLRKAHAAHWANWPDMELPALNGKTPREAAKTEQGRRRLEALFAEFHSHNITGRAQFPVDLQVLREALGMGG